MFGKPSSIAINNLKSRLGQEIGIKNDHRKMVATNMWIIRIPKSQSDDDWGYRGVTLRSRWGIPGDAHDIPMKWLGLHWWFQNMSDFGDIRGYMGI